MQDMYKCVKLSSDLERGSFGFSMKRGLLAEHAEHAVRKGGAILIWSDDKTILRVEDIVASEVIKHDGVVCCVLGETAPQHW